MALPFTDERAGWWLELRELSLTEMQGHSLVSCLMRYDFRQIMVFISDWKLKRRDALEYSAAMYEEMAQLYDAGKL